MIREVVLFAAAVLAAAPASGLAAFTSGLRQEVANLDKTGTTWSQRKEAGSQTLAEQVLASPLFSTAEGTGLEPATGFPAPHFQSDDKQPKSPETEGDSESGRNWERTDSENSPPDSALTAVVKAWPALPEALKAGILAMVKAALLVTASDHTCSHDRLPASGPQPSRKLAPRPRRKP